MKTLYIIRGLPGSGKSTLARRLTDIVFEADQFFETIDGYRFDPEKLGNAHSECQKNVAFAMTSNLPVIAVANTFTQRWEIIPYLAMALHHEYTVQEITMSGPLWPSVHGVPPEQIERMRNRWER